MDMPLQQTLPQSLQSDMCSGGCHRSQTRHQQQLLVWQPIDEMVNISLDLAGCDVLARNLAVHKLVAIAINALYFGL